MGRPKGFRHLAMPDAGCGVKAPAGGLADTRRLVEAIDYRATHQRPHRPPPPAPRSTASKPIRSVLLPSPPGAWKNPRVIARSRAGAASGGPTGKLSDKVAPVSLLLGRLATYLSASSPSALSARWGLPDCLNRLPPAVPPVCVAFKRVPMPSIFRLCRHRVSCYLAPCFAGPSASGPVTSKPPCRKSLTKAEATPRVRITSRIPRISPLKASTLESSKVTFARSDIGPNR